MLKLFDGLRGIGYTDVVVRMLLACLCGTVIGLERSMKNRPAGFRTHILVCLGACVAAFTGMYLYLGLELPADISRICGQVITGLGFIGAGTIIITRKVTIKGLTTAAGLWTTGVIGLAIGSGYIELGLVATALVLLTETVISRLGRYIRHSPESALEIAYTDRKALDQVLRLCKDRRMSIVNLKIRASEAEPGRYIAEVQLRGDMRMSELTDKISTMAGIESAIVL